MQGRKSLQVGGPMVAFSEFSSRCSAGQKIYMFPGESLAALSDMCP